MRSAHVFKRARWICGCTNNVEQRAPTEASHLYGTRAGHVQHAWAHIDPWASPGLDFARLLLLYVPLLFFFFASHLDIEGLPCHFSSCHCISALNIALGTTHNPLACCALDFSTGLPGPVGLLIKAPQLMQQAIWGMDLWRCADGWVSWWEDGLLEGRRWVGEGAHCPHCTCRPWHLLRA